MQHRFYNLRFKKAVRIFSLICSLFFFNPSALGNGSESEGPDSGTQNAIMQLSTVKGAVSAIDRLNQAMETAAKNPNDEWRREEVRKAMREVPTAVQALAGTFSAHTMGSSSLPFVLSTLGAAVDVNAPNSFDKFLKDPSADLSPLGRKDLPKSNDSKEEVSLILNEASLGESSTAYKAPSISGRAPITSSVSKSDTAVLDFSLKSATTSSMNNSTSSSSRTPASYPAPETSKSSADLEGGQSAANKTPLVNTLESDISQAEKILTELEASKKEEEDFFETKPKSKKEEKTENESKRPLGPVSLLETTLIFLAERVISQEVFAEAGVAGGGLGQGNPLNGTPTNPQDGNGGGAGQILFGLAQIMTAVAPMIVANTEAQKEQNIAQIETQAQVKQAEIQTETQKELANLSAQTALSQAGAQKDIAVLNNNAQSERLQLNLAAAQQQRDEERQTQAQQLALQQQLEAQKLALAQAQADQTLQLARQNLEAQRLQAALNDTGVAPSNLPAGGLAQSGASLNMGLNTGNPLASALAAQAIGTNPAASAGSAGVSGVNPANAGPVSNARGIRRSDSDGPQESLLAAAVDPEEEFSFMPRRNRMGSRGQRRTRGIYRNGLSLTAAGSFPEQRRALRGRDLSQFTQANPLEEGFETRSRLPGRAISSTH